MTIPRRLFDGRIFSRRRFRVVIAAFFAVELAVFAFLVAGTHGWIVPMSAPTTTDFVSFYAAGSLADAGTPALAYDHTAHLAAEERATEPGIRYQYFNYPPVFLLLCAALAALPYLVAFVVFEGGTLALFLFVGSRILGDRSATALVALAGFPIVWWNFGLGQNAFLTASLFGAGTLLIDRSPFIAGLLLGALCIKPQLALMLPVALLATGRWRAIAGGAISATALALLSVALFGTETWRAFLATASASPTMYQSGRILFAGMANPFGAARLLGLGTQYAYGVQAAAAVFASAAVVIVWRRKLLLPTRAAVLASASLVAAPLALLYDLMLGAVAAAWLLRDRDSAAASPWEPVALAVLYLVVLDGVSIGERWHVPVFPLAAVALFAAACARAWREAALMAGTGSLRARTDETPPAAAIPSRSASPPR